MKHNISRVAVLGAGTMGAGIAALFAGIGVEVLLLDIVPNALTNEEKDKGLTLQDNVIRNKFAQNGKESVLNPKARAIFDKSFGNLIEVGNFDDDLEKIAKCDLIIEVVVERLDVKKGMMEKIARYRQKNSIVATNTSGISVNAICEDMDDEFKEHFIGTHFFNPPRYMKLFEVIAAKSTLPEVVETINDLAIRRLGKSVVTAKDTPNFIANAVGGEAMGIAMKLTEEYGYSIPKVDALTGQVIGWPKTATYRLSDMIGIDVIAHIGDDLPSFINDLVAIGAYGDKAGGGFYKNVKTPQGRKKLVWDFGMKDYVELVPVEDAAVESAKKMSTPGEKVRAMVWGEDEENEFAWELLKGIILFAARKVPEIADDFKQIDNAMRWGFNWTMGPFELWDAIGFEDSLGRMKAEGEEIPEWITDFAIKGKKAFYNRNEITLPYICLKDNKSYAAILENEGAALKDIGDGVAVLEFNTKNNAIEYDVLDMICRSIDFVEKEDYKGIVIGNNGKNFSVGANLNQIVGHIEDKDWNYLDKLIRDFQNANMRIKYAKKPIVVCVQNMALGGGAEIAMSGYRQVNHVETYMGLVEIGVGLVPGGGGVKELLVRYNENAGDFIISDRIKLIRKAWEVLAMAKVSGSAHEAKANKFLKQDDRIVMNSDYLISEGKKEVIHLFDAGFVPKFPKDIIVTGPTGMASMVTAVEYMKEAKYISEYDAYIGKKLAFILSGGDVIAGTAVGEQMILDLEREVFLSLCGEKKTQERIMGMLKTGKAVRN